MVSVIRDFGVGTIVLGFVFLVTRLDTAVFGDFTQFSPTQLLPIILGLTLIAIYFFLRPAFRSSRGGGF